jgi:hypothetical protein
MTTKVTKELYSQFLLATQGKFSALWLSELLGNKPAHDTFTRWLAKTKLKPHMLWEYTKPLVNRQTGYLIIDDTVLDKWYGPKIHLAQSHYSGTHHRLVRGIDIINLVWTNGENAEHIPVDFRIFAKKQDGYSKIDHCNDMLTSAFMRGFTPQAVLMDAWYSALSTLQLIRNAGWIFITALKGNRLVSLVPHEHRSVADLATEDGILCHLKDFGKILLFKLVRPDDDIEYLATNDLSLSILDIRNAAARRWRVEEYHRGVKQLTAASRCQARNDRSQRNHIFCSIFAFLALEKRRLETGISCYVSKQQIIAFAIQKYLEQPFIPLPKALP